MKSITTDFQHISFHDASLDKIVRRPGVVSIEFCGAFVSKEHPAALGRDWTIERGTLELLKVRGEEALFWYGDRVSMPHPEPDFPLDEVMHVKFDGTRFAFDGFLKNVPWYTWSVVATDFSLITHAATHSVS
jgi:hypothetical protein